VINSDQIKAILQDAFSPEFIQIVDDSEQHLGHSEGKKSGGGHYSILLVSDSFEGKTMLERHRAVYEAMEMDRNKGIHALAIKVYTSGEWKIKDKG